MTSDHDGRVLTACVVDDERGAGYRCVSCGYGVATPVPPRACPMCRRSTWSHAFRNGRPLEVRCVGSSTFRITPPPALDAAASMLLVETIAELASARPDVVLDLTGVVVGDSSETNAMLLRLRALAHCAGGRLLVVRAGGAVGGIDAHESERVGVGVAARLDA